MDLCPYRKIKEPSLWVHAVKKSHVRTETGRNPYQDRSCWFPNAVPLALYTLANVATADNHFFVKFGLPIPNTGF